MKKLLNPLPNGGFPLENEDILQLQDGLYGVLANLCDAAGAPVVLSGCQVTASDPQTKTCTVSPGLVYLSGQFRNFGGYQGSYPFYLVPDTSAFTTKTYQNGSVQNSYVAAQAKAVTAKPSGSGFIGFGLNGVTSGYKDVILAGLNTALADEAQHRQAADTELQAEIDAINQALPTKATKKYTAIPWTDLPLTASGYSVTSVTLKKAQYMMDEFGMVRLRGGVSNNSFIADQNLSSLLLAIVPASLLPPQDMRFNPHIQFSTKYYLDGATGAQMQSSANMTQYHGAYLQVIGKENAGSQTGGLYVNTLLPIFDTLYASLEGVSWNISA